MDRQINGRLAKICSVIAFPFLFVLLPGCETPSDQSTSDTEKPGLYNLHGWANKPYHAYNNQADDADIDGKVGYPLTVSYPTARAVPGGNWTSNVQTVSGTLPPGLSIDNSSYHQITGIPTERGHWIVNMKVYNLKVGDTSYGDFQQTLRFHITGSGQVNE
jgi:hypothetical protein